MKWKLLPNMFLSPHSVEDLHSVFETRVRPSGGDNSKATCYRRCLLGLRLTCVVRGILGEADARIEVVICVIFGYWFMDDRHMGQESTIYIL